MGDRSRREIIDDEKHVRMIPGGGIGGDSFIVEGIGARAGLDFGLPGWGGMVGGPVVGGIRMTSLTEYKQPVHRKVAETVDVGRSKCCIACPQAVEHL